MRKMASWKGIGPLNRPPLSVRLVSFRKRINPQSSPDLGVKTSSSLQRCYLRSSSYAQTNTFRSGFRMDQQREARQAIFLSRRGLKNGFEPHLVFEVDSNTNTIKRRSGNHMQSDERLSVSSVSPASQTVHLSSPASSNSCRYPSRPESFLFRAAIREDVKRGSTPPPAFSSSESTTVRTEQKSKVRQEEREGTEQLRKHTILNSQEGLDLLSHLRLNKTPPTSPKSLSPSKSNDDRPISPLWHKSPIHTG
ncbi:UAP56-interacting factor-like isoform X4 [Xenopus laevis]|uniref:UAP56-interacting factor n=1 Tax=Xenopus laevis TaxID=8355 RepID=A0A8J1KPC0_XENLA|nr:UAP56-interacting factor-like isoform X4 [Xenopus laevis]